MQKIRFFISDMLEHPLRVFVICITLSFLSLLLNGSFLQLYGLDRDREILRNQIGELRHQIAFVDQQLILAKDPQFIQRQALDKYDLVSDHDLVFVFADE